MAYNDNFRSRFMKLAGLSNTRLTANKPTRQLIGESQVSKLLNSGYTYRDIVLLEQANQTPKTPGQYIIDVIPTREGLKNYMKNELGYIQDDPTTTNLSKAVLSDYLRTLGWDDASLEWVREGGVYSPFQDLYDNFKAGQSDEELYDFLTTDERMRESVRGAATRNASYDGVGEGSAFQQLNSPAYDQAGFESLLDPTEVEPEEPESLDNETKNEMTKELLQQQYPNAPEGYIDSLLALSNSDDQSAENVQKQEAMTDWLGKNESLYLDGSEFFNYDEDYDGSTPIPEPEYNVNVGDPGDPMYGALSDTVDSLIHQKPKEFQEWITRPENANIFNQVSAYMMDKGYDAETILNPEGQPDFFEDLSELLISNDGKLSNEIIGQIYNQKDNNGFAQNLIKDINFDIELSNAEDIKNATDLNTKYQNYQAMDNNPFEEDWSADDYAAGNTVTNQSVDNTATNQSVDNTATNNQSTTTDNQLVQPNVDPIDTSTTTTSGDQSTTTTSGDQSTTTTTNNQNKVNVTPNTQDKLKPLINFDKIFPDANTRAQNRTNRGYRSVQIAIDPNTHMPVPKDTEGALLIDPDTTSGLMDYSKQTAWSQNYMKTNFPNIEPGTKKYDKLTKKYNKELANVHKQHQKDLWNSDLKGKEVDYDSYHVSITRNQKKNQKKNQKNADIKIDGQNKNIKLKDLYNTTLPGTNIHISGDGRLQNASKMTG